MTAAIFTSGMACEDTSKQLKSKHSLNLTGLPATQKHPFSKIPGKAERREPVRFILGSKPDRISHAESTT